MLRTRKDILAIVLSIVVGSMALAIKITIEGITNVNWNLPAWLIITAIVCYCAVLVALGISIIMLVKGINNINIQQDSDEKESKAKINAIINKLGITPEEIAESRDRYSHETDDNP